MTRHEVFATADTKCWHAAGGVLVLSLEQADRYQRVMLRLRHAAVPTVAAVRGVAVSGACELLMHVTRVVAHSQSFIGLAEASPMPLSRARRAHFASTRALLQN